MGSTHRFDIAVVGAGAVGLSTAYRLAQSRPDLSIVVIDKADTVSAHQTGHNSGVIHSGVYYKPGSFKATLCVRGREQLVAFAQEFGVPHEVCGKVIVATTEAEHPQLDMIFERGIQNGLPDIRRISGDEIQAYEPHCRGTAAIHVPYTGIIDYAALCQRLADRLTVLNPANRIRLGFSVTGIRKQASGYTLSAGNQQLEARLLVSCAGLQSDRLARMEGLRPDLRIVGFRGDYYDLTPAAKHKVRNLIYPVPDPAFPFLGVHFTRMTDGTVECGPNAVPVFAREGYSKTAWSWRDVRSAFGYGGTLKLFRKHWRMGLDEYRRAFSKRRFWKTLTKLMPDLQMEDIQPGRCGIRAQAVNPDGTLVDDFRWAETDTSVHVLNAPSPAATACLAIGEVIAERALERLPESTPV